MAFATARDNTRLFYKDWGTGSPIILMHGWPLQADSWDSLAVELVHAGHRVITYDRRGFGRSDQPWNGYDYDSLADDLRAIIEHTGVTNATIAGFSMGGGEVARYMSRHGGKDVGKAILISSVVPFLLKTPDNPEGVEQETLNGIAQSLRDDRAHFFNGFFKDFYGAGLLSKPVSNETLEWTRSMAMQGSLRATLACAEAFGTTDFRPDLPHFKVPTLIIHGTDDETVPIDATGRAAAKVITNAQLVKYNGAPHGLTVTHGDRLAKDMLSFLSVQ